MIQISNKIHDILIHNIPFHLPLGYMSLETYGFAIYIAAFAFSVIWLCWSFVPDNILNYMGIIYYPSKYWAAMIPSIIIVAYISWFIYYTLSVLVLTIPREISASCADSFSKSPKVFEGASIPPLCDIPIDSVNKLCNK